MLKTTSQQLIDSLGYEGGRPGQPLKVGVTLDQTNQAVASTAGDLYSVPAGNVLLITHVVMQIDQSGSIAQRISSPTEAMSFDGINFYDGAGTAQGGVTFRGFSRYRTIFTGGGGSPDFRASQPGEVVSWRPKFAIPVPSGWSVQQPLSSIGWGHQSCVYGVLVSESAAQEMGYHVSKSVTDSERRYGIANTAGSTSATDLVAARTGKSIRILDVHIRSQPETVTDNTLTLQQTDGTKVFKFVNDNPSELINQAFSPGWYLKAGQALQVISDEINTCSINVTYEYVDEDEVPSDYWFSVVEPTNPTPGAGTTGLLGSVSTEATLYYPRRGTTETDPNKGFQHMLNGYAVYSQKEGTTANATDDTEQTRFTISTGATGGEVDFSLAGLNQPNYQMAPVFSGSGHNQCTWCVVDGINVPGKKDDGSLWVDTIAFGTIVSTPTSANVDVRDWAVNMWGRTVPAQFSARTNEGT